MTRTFRFTALMIILHAATAPATAAIQKIEEASEEVRAAMNEGGELSPAAQASLRKLEAALANGERVNSSLKNEVKALEDERAKLQDAQTVLKSGLVGALVTMIVAIFGAFLTSRNSKPERDLKRLAVIEKVRELKAANVKLPRDLARADGTDS